jgi:type II secretion system protein I
VSASKPRDNQRLPGQRHPCRGSDGFTLFEVLIAIVILTMSLSALLPSFSGGLRGATAIDDHMRARLFAQSVMAETTHNRDPQPAVRQGQFEQFTWSLAVTPYDADVVPQPAWRLHRLVLTVAWSPGRHIELQTLRMMRSR